MSNSLNQFVIVKGNLIKIILKYQQLLDCKNADHEFKEIYDNFIKEMIIYIDTLDENSNKEAILGAFVDSLNSLNFLLGVDENYQITRFSLKGINLTEYSNQILYNLEDDIEYCKSLEIKTEGNRKSGNRRTNENGRKQNNGKRNGRNGRNLTQRIEISRRPMGSSLNGPMGSLNRKHGRRVTFRNNALRTQNYSRS